jgi:hypothetical protein
VRILVKLFPTSIREAIFLFLTFINVGLGTYFVSADFQIQAIFSFITSLLCFGVWYSQLAEK